ncbi:aspartic proteinase Asp1 isoform X3 [Triticum aestivum]|nr:aspartic proteinase Asp1-like isoform X3 [Triticum aestivum]
MRKKKKLRHAKQWRRLSSVANGYKYLTTLFAPSKETQSSSRDVKPQSAPTMAAMWSRIIGLLLLLPLGPSSAIKFPLIGNVYPDGHFYATLQIGHPLKPYFLDIDTGSNLTWLECDLPHQRCKGCHPRPAHPHYKPAAHNLMVRCHSWICAELRKDLPGSPKCPKNDPDRCHYDIQYVSGKSKGVLVNDMMFINGRDDKNCFFGCGYEQEEPVDQPSPPPVDGILGLGRGNVGFVAQLKVHNKITKNVIGHCLSIHGNGNLYIGDFRLPDGHITWVPMSRSLPYYSPGPATLLYDKHPIRDNPAFNVVFDSGSTYTYMPGQIYHDLLSKVQETLRKSPLKKVYDPALPQCWKGIMPFRSVDNVKNEFKALSLKITHAHVTSNFNIPPENYLIVTKYGNVCLGILDGSSHPLLKHLILIGDVTMQDLFVIYDNDKNRLGWINAQCNAMHDLESPTRLPVCDADAAPPSADAGDEKHSSASSPPRAPAPSGSELPAGEEVQRRRGRGELRWRSGRKYKSRRRIQGNRGAAALGRWQVRGIVAEGMPSTRLVPAVGGERGGGALAPAATSSSASSSSLDMPPMCRSFSEVVDEV